MPARTWTIASSVPHPRRRRVQADALARRRRRARLDDGARRPRHRRRLPGVRRDRPRRRELSPEDQRRPLNLRSPGGSCGREAHPGGARHHLRRRRPAGGPARRRPRGRQRHARGPPARTPLPPRHRRRRTLGGYSNLALKRSLLAAEGLVVTGRRVRHFADVRWPWQVGQSEPIRLHDNVCSGRGQPLPGMASSKPTGDVRSADLDLAGRIRSGETGGVRGAVPAARHPALQSGEPDGRRGTRTPTTCCRTFSCWRIGSSGSFRGESSLGTWLYRLAMNHCLDVLRSRQTRMGQQTDSLDEPDAAPVASPAPALGAVSRIDLERAIESLPPACRAAFLLHDVEGFGHQEVGDDSRDLGRHVEIAGAQGAAADPRVSGARERQSRMS